MKRKALSLLLTFVLVFNLFSLTVSASAADTAPSNSQDSNITLASGSAGLYWGPIQVGNIKFALTNPHSHKVGPYGIVEHVNLHVTDTTKDKDIANYHIFKAVLANGKECMIVWDSITKTEVFRHCDDNNWTNAVTEFVSLVGDTVSTVLDHADFLATVVIGGLIIVAIVDLVIPLDPIPLIPVK